MIMDNLLGGFIGSVGLILIILLFRKFFDVIKKLLRINDVIEEKKAEVPTKKNKKKIYKQGWITFILLSFIILFFFTASNYDNIKQYLYWKNKEFTINRWTPSCSNPELSKFKYDIELKYDDGKTLYKISIVSNSLGIYDIREVECLNNNYIRSFNLLDEDGFLLHSFDSRKFIISSDNRGFYFYIDRGEINMSFKLFRKNQKHRTC